MAEATALVAQVRSFATTENRDAIAGILGNLQDATGRIDALATRAEPTPAMVQTLLVNSLLNRGGFRLVSQVGAGLMPDYTLMCEIQAFQAELTGPDLASAQIHIALQMTVIREANRSIAGTRGFATTASVTSDSTVVLIVGIDAAMQSVMADAIGWVQTLA